MPAADHLTTRCLDRPATLRGMAAIMSALDQIGDSDSDDHKFTRLIVDAELDVRAVVNFALAHLASEAA